LVLVDEAYSDFAGTSLVSRMDEFPNLIVSKTFSKVLAAAGLRVGSLIVHPELMGYFTAAALPYNVSTLTLAVAARVAKDDAAIAHRLELAAKERARVLAALRRVQDIEVFPSVTNFILFQLRSSRRDPFSRRGEPRLSRLPRASRVARARRHVGERRARFPQLRLAPSARPQAIAALRRSRRRLAARVPRRGDAQLQVAPRR